MSDAAERQLNHFTVFRFTDDYWRAPADARRCAHDGLMKGWRAAAESVHLYQLYPSEPNADFLVWSALHAKGLDAPGRFFEAFTRACTPHRKYVEPTTVLWGFTRPSQYSKARSRQEIDPFPADRAPYLVIYPFSKTAEWYAKPGEERQEMMNEHIRIGKQYTDIKQLLLYSFGLQDQEFNVVYETDDLTLFSQLVYDLRMTQARIFTLNDTPVHTAMYRGAEAPFELWG